MSNNYKKYSSLRFFTKFSLINYAQSAMSFIVTFLIAKSVDVEFFGVYAFGLVVMNISSTVIQYGLQRTLVRDLVRTENPYSLVLASAILKIALVLIVLAPTLIVVHSFIGNESYLFLVLCIALLGGVAGGLGTQAWFDYKGKLAEHAKITFHSRSAFLLISIPIILFSQDYEVPLRVISLFSLIRICLSLYEWQYFFSHQKKGELLVGSQLLSLLGTNIFVWIAVVGNLFMSQFNQLILESIDGGKALGVYALAFQIIMVVRLLQYQIVRLVTPKIAVSTARKHNNMLKQFFKDCCLGLSATMFVVVPVGFLCPLIIPFALGASYEDPVGVLYVLLVWLVIQGAGGIVTQYALSMNLQKKFCWYNLLFGSLSMILAWVLVPRFSAFGAAYSLLIAHSLSAICVAWVVIGEIKIVKKLH